MAVPVTAGPACPSVQVLQPVEECGGPRAERHIAEHDEEHPADELGLAALDLRSQLRSQLSEPRVQDRNRHELRLSQRQLDSFGDRVRRSGSSILAASARLNEFCERVWSVGHVKHASVFDYVDYAV